MPNTNDRNHTSAVNNPALDSDFVPKRYHDPTHCKGGALHIFGDAKCYLCGKPAKGDEPRNATMMDELGRSYRDLTPREEEIACLYIEHPDWSRQQFADVLGITKHSVDAYIRLLRHNQTFWDMKEANEHVTASYEK
jgi:hypothetical protein